MYLATSKAGLKLMLPAGSDVVEVYDPSDKFPDTPVEAIKIEKEFSRADLTKLARSYAKS